MIRTALAVVWRRIHSKRQVDTLRAKALELETSCWCGLSNHYRIPFFSRMPSGDDLEDDYVPDANLVVVSEEEYEEFNGLGDVDSNPGADEDKSSPKKRKRREKEKEKRTKVSNPCRE